MQQARYLILWRDYASDSCIFFCVKTGEEMISVLSACDKELRELLTVLCVFSLVHAELHTHSESDMQRLDDTAYILHVQQSENRQRCENKDAL